MKKYLVTLVIMLAFAGSLHAVIGWSGNIWPNSYTDQTNGFDITVYYQIWKDGVTNLPGRGDSLSATIYYKTQSQTSFSTEAMIFNVDVGNNDEYSSIIPNSIFASGDTVFSIVKVLTLQMQPIPMEQISPAQDRLMPVIPDSTI